VAAAKGGWTGPLGHAVREHRSRRASPPAPDEGTPPG
jgi:hypothetical protein